jgi:hypothetical protein
MLSNSTFLPLYNNPLHQSTLHYSQTTTSFQSGALAAGSLSYSSGSSNFPLTTPAILSSHSHQNNIPASDPHFNKQATFKRKSSLKVKNIIMLITTNPPINFQGTINVGDILDEPKPSSVKQVRWKTPGLENTAPLSTALSGLSLTPQDAEHYNKGTLFPVSSFVSHKF